MPIRFARTALLLGLSACVFPAAAQARWGGPGWADGGWGGPGWGADPWSSRAMATRANRTADSGEGRITVSRFVAEGPGAGTLGKGIVAVTGAPTGSGVESRELAVYEAATIDQLAQLGYRTDRPASEAGQVTELHVTHDEVAPQKVKKPVSGAATVGMSNRGSMMGLAMAVDLSKPRGALIATRLEARIRDRATGAVLWEGRADVVTRQGSDTWTEGVIANRLAAALFDGFPKSGES